MAGKICTGDGTKSGAPSVIKESRAYCEGRAAQLDGQLVVANPYLGQGAAMLIERLAWTAGHNAATADEPKGCCAR